VIHYGHCVAAAERLVDLGGDVTADVIPFLSHEINTEVMDLLVDAFPVISPNTSGTKCAGLRSSQAFEWPRRS
jgi:hypothetical protein